MAASHVTALEAAPRLWASLRSAAGSYGIPVTVVGGGHRRVNVAFTYGRESDRVRYPFGSDTKIEGGRRSDGDRHAIVVDKSRCRLYETWNTSKRDGRWHAGSGAVWDMDSNALRHDGWTSADAAGLPILPGLLRWSEVRKGKVDHAIRFTTDVTDRRYVWPARHQAGSVNNRHYPPMGLLSLKASFDLSRYSGLRVVLRAMQNYGLVLADNGSPWYFQGGQLEVAEQADLRAQTGSGACLRCGRHFVDDGRPGQCPRAHRLTLLESSGSDILRSAYPEKRRETKQPDPRGDVDSPQRPPSESEPRAATPPSPRERTKPHCRS